MSHSQSADLSHLLKLAVLFLKLAMHRIAIAPLHVFAFAFVFAIQAKADTENESPQEIRRRLSPYMKMFVRDAAALTKNKAKIDLGRTLFYDKRLSATSTFSCNACHDLEKYGTNGTRYTTQREAEKTYRDVPSLYNLKSSELFNWDGQYTSLEAKTAAAITSPHEMNMPDKGTLVSRLAGSPGYVPLFQAAFPKSNKPVSFDNAVSALTEFQRGLITLAPIDRFLQGDDKALDPKQLRGGRVFDDKGCVACHTGATFGGQMVMKLGVTEQWPNQADQGLFTVTKDPKHKMAFRVSSLRNVAKTAPYFHGASSRRLWGAIEKMSRYELGQHISVDDNLSLVAFLRALTGDIPEDYIKKPAIP